MPTVRSTISRTLDGIDHLRPDGTVTVRLSSANGTERLAVPVTAVLQNVQGPYVWVVGAIGICTCVGMLASTFIGILFVPALYCIVERIREELTGKRGPRAR